MYRWHRSTKSFLCCAWPQEASQLHVQQPHNQITHFAVWHLHTHTDTHTDTHRHRHTHTHTHTDRHTQTHTNTDTHTQTQTHARSRAPCFCDLNHLFRYNGYNQNLFVVVKAQCFWYSAKNGQNKLTRTLNRTRTDIIRHLMSSQLCWWRFKSSGLWCRG